MPSTGQRVAFVTGGAMGIGAEVCARLAKVGSHVMVADLNIGAATETAHQLKSQGMQATAIELDVGLPQSIARAFSQVEAEHGRCDILVNCAGVAKVFPFLEFPLDNFLHTMNINLTGTMLCGQHAARLMVKTGWGRIVNIASVSGMRAVGSGRTAYGTSKAAVIGLTRQMAVELAEHGITVNAIAPGPIDTPMTRDLHTDQFRHAYTQAISISRYGKTSEVAAAVVYLSSEDAAYVTGIVMPVDGGFLSAGAKGL